MERVSAKICGHLYESIENEVDNVILPAIQTGKLPFKGIPGSADYANVQRLAEISLQLLKSEFSGKSREEIIEMIEESISAMRSVTKMMK